MSRGKLRYQEVRFFFAILAEASGVLTLLAIMLRIVRAVLPWLLLLITKRLIDVVYTHSRNASTVQRAYHLIALEFSLVLLGELISHAVSYVDCSLGEQLSTFVSIKMMSHGASLDLKDLESPSFYDRLDRARGQSTGRLQFLISLLNSCQETGTLLALCASLCTMVPWLTVLVIVAVLPALFGEWRFSQKSYAHFYHTTPVRRELEYLRSLASSPHVAKEVRLFGFVTFLQKRYKDLASPVMLRLTRMIRMRALWGSGLDTVALLGYYSAFALAVRGSLHASISVGTLTFMIGTLARVRLSVSRIAAHLTSVGEQGEYIADLKAFFETRSLICDGDEEMSAGQSGIEITCENVSFQYSPEAKPVIEELALTIRPREIVAIVGENGAGKSTLIKLLTRMYDPTSGVIRLNGRDIRTLTLSGLREVFAVIFQDFVRYDLSLRENIGIGGAMKSLSDTMLTDAAHEADLASLMDGLGINLGTRLGSRFGAARELSGGQWQRVALARAFVREAPVFIFDEPTASLDASAEARFMSVVRGALGDRTVLLITHKLSTARQADRILVMDHGRLSEEGSHEALIKHDGIYARMYKAQAGAFAMQSGEFQDDV